MQSNRENIRLAQKNWKQEIKAKEVVEGKCEFRGNEVVREDEEDGMEVMPSVVMKKNKSFES